LTGENTNDLASGSRYIRTSARELRTAGEKRIMEMAEKILSAYLGKERFLMIMNEDETKA